MIIMPLFNELQKKSIEYCELIDKWRATFLAIGLSDAEAQSKIEESIKFAYSVPVQFTIGFKRKAIEIYQWHMGVRNK